MFGPGVRHHQGAPPRSVYWRLALKKALHCRGANPGQTLQAEHFKAPTRPDG